MADVIRWRRPSGSFIETNSFSKTIEVCEALGWERDSDKPKDSSQDESEVTEEGIRKMRAAGLKKLCARYDLPVDVGSFKDINDARDAVISELFEDE